MTTTKPELRISKSPQSITFSIKSDTGCKLAVLDLSLMLSQPEQCPAGRWYYFNRINIPTNFTPANAALWLYHAMTVWADYENIHIYNEISPYSNSKLNTKQIMTFESLYGFKKLPSAPNTTIRLANSHA